MSPWGPFSEDPPRQTKARRPKQGQATGQPEGAETQRKTVA